jgi:WhiB family redox-sensing transcriptional regulator
VDEPEDSWRDEAACKNAGPWLFFSDGEDYDTRDKKKRIERAKRVCGGCMVSDECLAFGLHEPFGIWGGLDEKERRLLLRRSRQVPGKPSPIRARRSRGMPLDRRG